MRSIPTTKKSSEKFRCYRFSQKILLSKERLGQTGWQITEGFLPACPASLLLHRVSPLSASIALLAPDDITTPFGCRCPFSPGSQSPLLALAIAQLTATSVFHLRSFRALARWAYGELPPCERAILPFDLRFRQKDERSPTSMRFHTTREG